MTSLFLVIVGRVGRSRASNFFSMSKLPDSEINSICSEFREKYRVPKIYGGLLGDPLGPVINRTSRFLRKRRACVFPIRLRFHRTYRCVF